MAAYRLLDADGRAQVRPPCGAACEPRPMTDECCGGRDGRGPPGGQVGATGGAAAAQETTINTSAAERKRSRPSGGGDGGEGGARERYESAAARAERAHLWLGRRWARLARPPATAPIGR